MLDRLTQITPFWDFLTFTLTTPLGIPAMLLLVDRWHYSKKTIKRLALALCLFFVLYLTTVYRVMGVTSFSKSLIGASAPVISFTVFIICTRYRDGRLLFTIVTALFLAGITEALATILAPRSTPLWVLVKIGLTLAQGLVIWRFIRVRFQRMLNTADAAWLQMSILPVSMVFCLGGFYLRPVIGHGEQRPALPTVVFCVFAFLVYLALFRLTEVSEARATASRDNVRLSAQMDSVTQRAEDLLRRRESLMTFRHDMRHFLGIIRDQAAAGDMAGIEAVLESVHHELDQLSVQYALWPYTGVVMIDSVLSKGAERARANGIEYTVELTLAEGLLPDMVKLSVVLSNAIENAVNACLQMEAGAERAIRVTGGLRGRQFYLTVANTFSGPVEFDRETGLPLTERMGHGYGSRSIAAFAREAGAMLSYSARDGWFYVGLIFDAEDQGG